MDTERNVDDRLSETISPMGWYVLVRPDEPKEKTAGGIILPGENKIPVLTGRILEIGPEAQNESHNFPISKYDKVIYKKSNQIPVDLEQYLRTDKDDGPALIPLKDIVAKVTTNKNDAT
jgi:co-chaperonin GroES (HSP10)